jgi:hypothetical protein
MGKALDSLQDYSLQALPRDHRHIHQSLCWVTFVRCNVPFITDGDLRFVDTGPRILFCGHPQGLSG